MIEAADAMKAAATGRFLFYLGFRRLFLCLARPLFRFRVEGRERLPRSGPAVVVAAHRSWLDPACVGAACTEPVRFLILDRVYAKRWARWFYRRMRSIPVSQGRAGSIAALRSALRHLQEGGWIGVFPEGRVVRRGESEQFRAGAALLAARSGAPLVPVTIQGSARAWPHGRPWPGPARVTVSIGEPIAAPAGSGRAALEAISSRLQELIAASEEG